MEIKIEIEEDDEERVREMRQLAETWPTLNFPQHPFGFRIKPDSDLWPKKDSFDCSSNPMNSVFCSI